MEYRKRDAEALGEFYNRHVSAMTAEGLHDKADIAAELAWRDMASARLLVALEPLERAIADGTCPDFMVRTKDGALLSIGKLARAALRSYGDAGEEEPRTAPASCPHCHDESDCSNVDICRAVDAGEARDEFDDQDDRDFEAWHRDRHD